MAESLDRVPAFNVVVEIYNDIATIALPDRAQMQAAVQYAVRAAGGPDASDCEISVRIVDEERSRALNKRYRQQDKSTNVLSVPAGDAISLPPGTPKLLGDIVLCGPQVEKEAAERGIDKNLHWNHLLVHGALHLLGYDHESDVEADEMERLEVSILAARGFDDPYQRVEQ